MATKRPNLTVHNARHLVGSETRACLHCKVQLHMGNKFSDNRDWWKVQPDACWLGAWAPPLEEDQQQGYPPGWVADSSANEWPADRPERRAVATLLAHKSNARKHSARQIEQIIAAIREFGWTNPILVDEGGTILAGHGRAEAAKAMGLELVPVMIARGWSEEQKRAYIIADNQLALNAGWDEQLLKLELADLQGMGVDLDAIGFGADQLAALQGKPARQATVSLADRFGVPPFSVLNAREGWWQERKRAWLALGIKSEIGRGDNMLKLSDTARLAFGQKLDPDARKKIDEEKAARARFGDKGMAFEGGAMPYAGQEGTGTSIFDPVLCELLYRWFSPPGGTVLDPFAGGSVRGIVAWKLGRAYVGIDLSENQIRANEVQAREISGAAEIAPPIWLRGDSLEMLPKLQAEGARQGADFLFTCPPYADLERYSDDPRDLSNMPYAEFKATFGKIIAAACSQLKPDRFAAIVVGDLRDKGGAYRGFPWHTVEAFQRAGLALHNEAVLVTAAGSLPIRAGKAFEASRKLGKTHQNVLIFCKGDARKAAKAVGAVEFGKIEALDDAAQEKV